MRLRRALSLGSLIAAVGVLSGADVAFGCTTSESAFRATLTMDLREVAQAETRHHRSTGRWSTDVAELKVLKHSLVRLVFEPEGDGVLVTGRHERLDYPCRVFVGARPTAARAGYLAGQAWCEKPYHWYDDEQLGMPISVGVLFSLVVMTITALAAFRVPAGKVHWTALALFATTLVQVAGFGTFGSCGGASVLTSGIVLLAGATFFAVGLRLRLPRSGA